ncbi:hypothetical protein DID80_04115 [Candidatus Marinamargulisbacteria bacterium SCGC AAA071-K20]|nr:hypothetical protein DID80_04115 [Candidatus Marinamargulisbacteria bacterium SCGC AAA071-K20]
MNSIKSIFKLLTIILMLNFTLTGCLTVSTVESGSSEISTDESDSSESTTNDPTQMATAFSDYSQVSTTYDSSYFYVSSDGIPDHQMMVGIVAWIAQVPVPHSYSGDNAWSIPLETAYSDSPLSIEDDFQRGALGIAVNGIPIFNPINASGLISKDIGELDEFGGHSGRGDDYHYHTAPIHLEESNTPTIIAYAFDGYPVYGTLEPDGSEMDTLDSYNGHEYSDGSYHYHGTTTYPFMLGAFRGTVNLEGTAPHTQVTPQSQAYPPRDGNPHAINSDLITGLTENATQDGYTLTYTYNGATGSVDYSWDIDNNFTYIFNDVDGSTTTEVFKRKN